MIGVISAWVWKACTMDWRCGVWKMLPSCVQYISGAWPILEPKSQASVTSISTINLTLVSPQTLQKCNVISLDNPCKSTGAPLNPLLLTGGEIDPLTEKLNEKGVFILINYDWKNILKFFPTSSVVSDQFIWPLWSSVILLSCCFEHSPITRCWLPVLFPGWQTPPTGIQPNMTHPCCVVCRLDGRFRKPFS